MQQVKIQNLSFLEEDEIFLLPEDAHQIRSQFVSSNEENSLISSEREEQKEKIANFNNPESEGGPQKEAEEVIQEAVQESIPLQGNFTKGILIVHEEEKLNAEIMDMLVKMITACGHSMNEVGLVSSLTLENRSMEEFQALNAHVVIKFGRIKHPINQFSFGTYEIQSEGETEYLFADALSSIAEDKSLKRKLWSALQLLFNLSPSNS